MGCGSSSPKGPSTPPQTREVQYPSQHGNGFTAPVPQRLNPQEQTPGNGAGLNVTPSNNVDVNARRKSYDEFVKTLTPIEPSGSSKPPKRTLPFKPPPSQDENVRYAEAAIGLDDPYKNAFWASE
jgi:hypothetical protein